MWELVCPHLVAASESQDVLLELAEAHAVKTTERACEQLLELVRAVPRFEWPAVLPIRLEWQQPEGDFAGAFTIAGHDGVGWIYRADDLLPAVPRP